MIVLTVSSGLCKDYKRYIKEAVEDVNQGLSKKMQEIGKTVDENMDIADQLDYIYDGIIPWVKSVTNEYIKYVNTSLNSSYYLYLDDIVAVYIDHLTCNLLTDIDDDNYLNQIKNVTTNLLHEIYDNEDQDIKEMDELFVYIFLDVISKNKPVISYFKMDGNDIKFLKNKR